MVYVIARCQRWRMSGNSLLGEVQIELHTVIWFQAVFPLCLMLTLIVENMVNCKDVFKCPPVSIDFQMTGFFLSLTPGSLHILTSTTKIIFSFEIYIKLLWGSYHLFCRVQHSPQASSSHKILSQPSAETWPSPPQRLSQRAQFFSWFVPKAADIMQDGAVHFT
jgi:hypothetical protein